MSQQNQNRSKHHGAARSVVRSAGRPGGEPLWNAPNDLAIFSPLRGRPNMVLNRRLPEFAARDVLPVVRFVNGTSARRANKLNPR